MKSFEVPIVVMMEIDGVDYRDAVNRAQAILEHVFDRVQAESNDDSRRWRLFINGENSRRFAETTRFFARVLRVSTIAQMITDNMITIETTGRATRLADQK